MKQRFCIGALTLPGHHHISLGQRHPTNAGFISAEANVIDGIWHDVALRIGFGHRGAEKLFEVRQWRSGIMLADRHDWLSAFSGELSTVMCIEQAMRLAAAPRALWLRTLLAEIARIHSHLSFLSTLTASEDFGLWETIDELRNAMLGWSGNRIHPMLNRVGGLACDMPEGWSVPLDDVRRAADHCEQLLEHTNRFRGLAVIDTATCQAYGLSGPVARAAGLDLDRRARGYLAYDAVFRPVPTRSTGDGHARLAVLIDELRSSADMAETLLAGVSDHPGEVSVRLARRLKVPEGEHWAELEAPWGIAGCLLVSRGGATPWRMALRTPSFANLSALEHALEGTPETSIADAIATVGYSVGDADK